jgi:hypothetical protein
MKLPTTSRSAFLAFALSTAGLSLFSAASVGCTSLKDTGEAADGASCSSTVNGGGDAAALTSALSSAPSGSCVVLVSQTYTGSFTVPAGVTLSSSRGTRAVFRSTDDKPAIELAGGANGAGASLFGIDVVDTKGVGIVVRGGGAHIQDVTVSGAKSAAIAVQCKDASCLDGNHVVMLDDVRMKTSAMGLWASGAHVRMKNGESSDHGGETLTGGLGIVAQDGSRLELTGTKVERNTSVGVLLDGRGGTTGQLTDVTVSHNAARGVWAQKLKGTLDAPSLRVEGKTLIEDNKIVGLGAADSHGIIIVGGRIGTTVAAPVVSNLGSTESIGDGIGIFAGAGDVRMEGVELLGNARAAALFDKSDGAIIIVGGKVEAGPSQLKVVVQNPVAGARVEVSTDVLSTVQAPLGVSAPDVPLARVLP